MILAVKIIQIMTLDPKNFPITSIQVETYYAINLQEPAPRHIIYFHPTSEYPTKLN